MSVWDIKRKHIMVNEQQQVLCTATDLLQTTDWAGMLTISCSKQKLHALMHKPACRALTQTNPVSTT